jgi:hypothetical protein
MEIGRRLTERRLQSKVAEALARSEKRAMSKDGMSSSGVVVPPAQVAGPPCGTTCVEARAGTSRAAGHPDTKGRPLTDAR